MTIKHVLQNASMTSAAVFLMVASASASPVSFNTNAVGTGFNNSNSNSLASSSGNAATLSYTDNGNVTVGVPSNVNYGHFTLVCATCTTQAVGTGSSVFNSFTFKLIITDLTDGATGFFTGSSVGGTIFSDVSPITVNWVPLQLGPGTTNATTGNFGTTFFQITSTSGIVAPNTGNPLGVTTVQGNVSSSAAPEPATFGLIGASLFSLGFLRRKQGARS